MGTPLDDPQLLRLKVLFGEFYNHFESQWWITDFGESVMYDPESDPDERKVVGLCAGKISTSIRNYQKVRKCLL